MKMIEAVETTSGSPAAVWALLGRRPDLGAVGSWSKFEVEGEGPQEQGAVRLLVRAPSCKRLAKAGVRRRAMSFSREPGLPMHYPSRGRPLPAAREDAAP